MKKKEFLSQEQWIAKREQELIENAKKKLSEEELKEAILLIWGE